MNTDPGVISPNRLQRIAFSAVLAGSMVLSACVGSKSLSHDAAPTLSTATTSSTLPVPTTILEPQTYQQYLDHCNQPETRDPDVDQQTCVTNLAVDALNKLYPEVFPIWANQITDPTKQVLVQKLLAVSIKSDVESDLPSIFGQWIGFETDQAALATIDTFVTQQAIHDIENGGIAKSFDWLGFVANNSADVAQIDQEYVKIANDYARQGNNDVAKSIRTQISAQLQPLVTIPPPAAN